MAQKGGAIFVDDSTYTDAFRVIKSAIIVESSLHAELIFLQK